MKDDTLRRLTACHLVEPDPPLWLLAADRCLELGDEAGAALWRRRGELYPGVRYQYDCVRGELLDHGEWRRYGDWEVGMVRYAQTVRVWTDRYGKIRAFAMIINVNYTGPRYVPRRLLELIDRLV